MSDYKLCGGTFFILLLEARQYGVGKRQQFGGNEDKMSELNVFQSLSLIVNSNLPSLTASMKNTVKGNVTNYKMCKDAGGTHFPYKDKQIIRTFDNQIKTKYSKVFKTMNEFVFTYLEISKDAKKDEYLIKALVDLIKKDNSIVEEQEFYIMKDGTTQTKNDILSMTEFNLTSFLLGIWHFAISIPNTQGKNTADLLCPSTNGGKRAYQGNLGDDDKRTLSITYTHSEAVDKEPIVEILYDIDENTKDAEEAEPQVVNQNVNSPFIFNFSQYGNNTTQIGHIENYYAHKEKKHNE